jgi:hypothetical protein
MNPTFLVILYLAFAKADVFIIPEELLIKDEAEPTNSSTTTDNPTTSISNKTRHDIMERFFAYNPYSQTTQPPSIRQIDDCSNAYILVGILCVSAILIVFIAFQLGVMSTNIRTRAIAKQLATVKAVPVGSVQVGAVAQPRQELAADSEERNSV